MTWHPDIPAHYRNAILTGDARELARALPDASVDLIFTDPVYERIEDYAWLAETAARVLKPGGNLMMYQAHLLLPATFCALADTRLTFRWLVFDWKIGTQTSVFGPRVLARTRAAMVYCKPPIPKEWLVDLVASTPMGGAVNHKWSKNPSAAMKWLSMFPDGVLFDPFCGGGTHPAVAKMQVRPFIAFEIDPLTAERARARVEQTQAMHPVLLGVQEEMTLQEAV